MSDYSPGRKRKDGSCAPHGYCKECVNTSNKAANKSLDKRAQRAKYMKEYYARRKAEEGDGFMQMYRDANKASYQKMKNEIMFHLGGVCVACGENDHDVLEIDHIHGGGGQRRRTHGHTQELRAIREALRNGRKSSRDLAVQLLCGNCHIRKTKGLLHLEDKVEMELHND